MQSWQWNLSFGIACTAFWLCSHATIAATQETSPQEVPFRVAVDPRVELFGILFRLAGNREYNQTRVKSYAADVDQHFGALRDHPAVVQARLLHDRRSVSYDVCMDMAVHVTDVDTLREKVPRQPQPEGLNRRWPAEEMPGFLANARKFAADGSLADFLRAHRELYETTESRLRELIRTQAHLEWFARFYGEHRKASFQVVPAILNGPQSYGPCYRGTDGTDDLYCILGVWHTDEQGNPVFPSDVLRIVVHEFCHSYANPLIDRHVQELQPVAEKLFRLVAVDMESQAYGHWKPMLYESLVRASVVRYLQRYEYRNVVWQTLREEKARGFLWIEEFSNLLGEYESHRAEYPTLDAFFPRIVKFLSDYADQATARDAELDSRRPRVVSITPRDHAVNVSPSLREIHVKFDRLMNISSWAVVGGGEHFPEVTGPVRYDLARTTCTIPVKLKPDWDYELMLNSRRHEGFQALDGTPLAPVRVRFRTSK